MKTKLTINFGLKEEKQKLFDFLKKQKGVVTCTFENEDGYLYKTRYKYYFGHMLKLIQQEGIFVTQAGEILSIEDIHTQLKLMFNPVMVVNTKIGTMAVSPGATTELSDGKFIQEYEPKIMSFFASPPFYLEFVDRDEWIAERKAYYRGIEKQTKTK